MLFRNGDQSFGGSGVDVFTDKYRISGRTCVIYHFDPRICTIDTPGSNRYMKI